MSESCQVIKKQKYGSCGYKNRRSYLVENNKIIYSRFTYEKKDYLVNDIKYYLLFYGFINKKYRYKKNELYNILSTHMLELCSYQTKYLKDIIKIQLFMKNYLKQKHNRNKCNNLEDFFTFEKLEDINSLYYYEYKDPINHKYWGFDIRSLKKLIDSNYPNPYTTQVVPQYIIEDVNKKLILIKQNKSYQSVEDIIIRDRKGQIKQNIVDLFSDIEFSGYTCQVEWFLELNIYYLKKLYKELEDIWNYRAQLTNHMKSILCPPNGAIFQTPIINVIHMNHIQDIQELIISNISQFKNCQSISDRKLGYMYFLIGLSIVSKKCYLAHQDWLAYV